MPKNAPTVMVSSTYYDLKQIRQDLANFIEKDLGYNALLSEFDSFPIDPNTDTVENCRRRVDKDADILVLIIGSRYGYVDKHTSKSVTNLEYLTARAKGIPVYAFIDKGILPLLPVWEQNPKAKFKDVVPDTKVFEFIRQVRTTDKVWTWEFDNAQTIIQTLRGQFAHLMHEGLQIQKRLSQQHQDIPVDISGKALRLVLEKPTMWEYRLFAQVLADEVDKHTDAREEYRLRLRFSQGETVTADTILAWTQKKMQEALRFASALSDIMNTHLQVAIGLPGVPGDPRALVFSAKKLAGIYRETLDWSSQIRHVHTDTCLQPVINVLELSTSDIIDKIGSFGPMVLEQLGQAMLLPEGSPIDLHFSLKIDTDLGVGTEFVNLMSECLENCRQGESYH